MTFPFHGAFPDDDGTQFRIWAPHAESLQLLRTGAPSICLTPDAAGIFETTVTAPPGTRYAYRINGSEPMPDPASRAQPDGVHGRSEVVDPSAYDWGDESWTGVDRSDLVVYELHVGTFTKAGTFDGVRAHLPDLADLGVTAIELMPLHAFPGRRNWGYDPAAFFAPPPVYGTPDDLRRLVDAAHRHGLAVLLDVIYNHLGPDGAYANAFAPFLTDAHDTPWGPAINLDDDGSAGVRRFFIDNALHWLREYHVDGLRLDATHALRDDSEPHFLAELSEAVETHVDGTRHLIAEDHRNLNRLVRPRNRTTNGETGYGLDAVWSDDFHHQVRTLTAGDSEGYYADYADATTADLARTIRDGWFFRGQVSEHFGGRRGTDPAPVDLDQCVFFIQNHDQVGNRPGGDRLTESLSLCTYRAVSTLLCLAPELPLLFMGQEWAAGTPFQFFTDHNDDIGPSVTDGRKEEFGDFPGFHGTVPDPQDPATFERSLLDWSERERTPHRRILHLYRDLLTLRKTLDAPLSSARSPSEGMLVLEQGSGSTACLVALQAGAAPVSAAIDEWMLHTEAPAYAASPHPPRTADDTIVFEQAGAVVLALEGPRHPADG